MTQNVSLVLQKLRSVLYHGKVRSFIRKSGLNGYLSGPYWHLVYILAANKQTHEIDGLTVDFRTDTYTEFHRFRNLEGEKEIIEMLLNDLGPTDVFFDIGANVGTYTCFVASRIGSDQTVAFEPEPQNITSLRENLVLNALDAPIDELALSDTDGTVSFALSGDEPGEGEHAIATKNGTNTIEVETARGDSVIDQQSLPKPTVLKIDVEGAELLVLRGLQETLRKHVRLVYVEIHPEKVTEFGDTAPEIRSFLEDTGFEIEELTERRDEYFVKGVKNTII